MNISCCSTWNCQHCGFFTISIRMENWWIFLDKYNEALFRCIWIRGLQMVLCLHIHQIYSQCLSLVIRFDVFFFSLSRRVLIFPKGNNNVKNHLSMYLDVANSAKLPSGWSSYAEFSLTVVNQINNEYSVRKGILFSLFLTVFTKRTTMHARCLLHLLKESFILENFKLHCHFLWKREKNWKRT